jgi:hypothetical protein
MRAVGKRTSTCEVGSHTRYVVEFRGQGPNRILPQQGVGGRGIANQNVRPALEYGVRNVELPIDLVEEGHFVGVDLVDFETRNLTPSSS